MFFFKKLSLIILSFFLFCFGQKDIDVYLPLKEKLAAFQFIEYYKSKDFQASISEKEALSLIEYYKVFLDSQIKKPVKEEHYFEYSLKNYRIFKYKKDQLQSIMLYDTDHTLLEEEIFLNQNEGETEKIVLKFEYQYYPSTKSLKEKKTYKNNIPDGRWIYYDKNGKERLEILYKNGQIKKKWEYNYDKNIQIKSIIKR